MASARVWLERLLHGPRTLPKYPAYGSEKARCTRVAEMKAWKQQHDDESDTREREEESEREKRKAGVRTTQDRKEKESGTEHRAPRKVQ